MNLENAIIRDGYIYKAVFVDSTDLSYSEYMDCQHCDMAHDGDGDGCVGCDLFENVARFTLIGALKSFIVEDLTAHAFRKKLVGQTYNIDAPKEEDRYTEEIMLVEERYNGKYYIMTTDKNHTHLTEHGFPEEYMHKLCAGESIDATFVDARNVVHERTLNIIFNETNES